MKSYESFIVKEYVGQTLIGYLNKKFPYHTQSEWEELIDLGRVLIAGKKASAEQLLLLNDRLTYIPIPGRIQEPEVDTEYVVVADHDEVLYVSKPPNLPIHPAGRYRTKTLLNFLERTYSGILPVHRIDRETSGLVLFAKTKDAHLHYQKLFEDRKIKKEYLAIVVGRFDKPGIVTGYIGKDLKSEIRKKQIFQLEEFESAKYSETEFLHIDYNTELNLSLILIRPKTGRIHQIRASLLFLGYPILGDKLYGKREAAFIDFINFGETEELLKELVHRRQALHSYSVSFADRSGEVHNIRVPLHKDLCHYFPNWLQTMSQNL
ncbi:MAG: RluA family pseudouridine synthase [Leptospira sp.]|nr:RluA family pseudouridine synthase [Leptospira sp.]